MIDLLKNIDYAIVTSMHGGNNLFLDGFVLTVTSSFTWIPLYIALLYLIIKNNENGRKTALIIACMVGMLLISNIVNNIIVKPWVARERPFQNVLLADALPLVKGYSAKHYSFYSSHTSNAFFLVAFICLLIRDKLLSIGLLAWAVTIGWTRVYLGVHYPSDLFVGMLMGSFFGFMGYILYYKLYKGMSDHLHFISSSYTKTGYSFSDIDLTLTVMVLIFIYAAFKAVLLS